MQTPNPQDQEPEIPGEANPLPDTEPQVVNAKPVEPKKSAPNAKADKKAILKKLALIAALVYLVVLILFAVWGFATGGKEISLFNVLPFSQRGFNQAFIALFNIVSGLAVLSALGFTLFSLVKFNKAKKETPEKKKFHSKRLLIGAGGFFVTTLVWLILLATLSAKLLPIQYFESPIITTPEDVIGLTAPVDITFDAGEIPISRANYEILAYTWNFGDGGTANGQVVTHRYTQKGPDNGRYTVTLDVDYQNRRTGEQSEASYQKEVSIENETVSADFRATPSSGPVPLEVEFDASASFDPDGDIVRYEWEFTGDDRFDDAEGEIVSYTFNQEGTFEVKLRVTDNNGDFNISTSTIDAGTVNGLRALITSEDVATDGTYLVGETYTFTAEASQIREGTITKYRWDFGDGSARVESRRTEHTFTQAGIFEVELTVQDPQGNFDTDYLEVTVVAPGEAPRAVITTSPAASSGVVKGPFPLTVEFDGTDSFDENDDIIEYQWDFTNDGEIDRTADSATYTYNEEGTYEARLVTLDSTGLQSEALIEIKVLPQGLVAVLNVDTTNGEVPLKVTFDASQSTYKGGNIVSYEYDWGDGKDSFIGGSQATYRYFDVGTFTAELTVIADDGERATDEVLIVVRPVAISACFTVGSDRGSAPFFLTLSAACSQGTIKSYSWDFGDGEVSFDRQPDAHIYEEPGIYTVSLEVTSEKGVIDTFEKTITVE